MALLRTIAAQRLRNEWLQRWWCKKFNRPSKDPLLGKYTMEELMVEFLQDEIELDPAAAFPAQTLENGIQFRNTGDAIVDQWERDVAVGDKPDFALAFKDSPDKAIFDAWLKPKKKRDGGQSPTAVVAERHDLAQSAATPQVDDEVPEWVKELDAGWSDDYTEKE